MLRNFAGRRLVDRQCHLGAYALGSLHEEPDLLLRAAHGLRELGLRPSVELDGAFDVVLMFRHTSFLVAYEASVN